MKRALTLVLGFLLVPGTVLAREVVFSNAAQNITVPNAAGNTYYGNLQGSPAAYTVTFDQTRILRAQLEVPKTEDASPNFSLTISQGQTEITTLTSNQWQPLKQRWSSDVYLVGPTFNQEVPPGTYTVQVANDTNIGNYVLLVGPDRPASFEEVAHWILVLPQIKHQYFGQSVFTAWFSRTVPAGIVFVAVVWAIMWLLIFLLHLPGRKRLAATLEFFSND